MKQKDIHIVFHRFGEGTLVHSNEFDPEKVRLVCLEDDLGIGPVCLNEAGAEERKRW